MEKKYRGKIVLIDADRLNTRVLTIDSPADTYIIQAANHFNCTPGTYNKIKLENKIRKCIEAMYSKINLELFKASEFWIEIIKIPKVQPGYHSNKINRFFLLVELYIPVKNAGQKKIKFEEFNRSSPGPVLTSIKKFAAEFSRTLLLGDEIYFLADGNRRGRVAKATSDPLI